MILSLSLHASLMFFHQFECLMGDLIELHIDETFINELSPLIANLIGLVLLNLRNCIRLSSLATEIGNLSSLKTLILNSCKTLDRIPPT